MKNAFFLVLLSLLVWMSYVSAQDTWEHITLPYTRDVEAFVVNSAGDIFVATNGDGVCKSSDNGDLWTPVNQGLESLSVHSLAINSSNHLFAGGTGVFKSEDNGENWSNIGLHNYRIWSLGIDSADAIYAGTLDGKMFKINNDGENWYLIYNGRLFHATVRCYAFDPNGDIFVGTNREVLRSTDNGNTWTPLGLTNTVNALIFNSDGHLFAGTLDGVFYSFDRGDSWIPVNTGLGNKRIYSLAINAGGRIFAGTKEGIYITGNNGQNWLATQIQEFLFSSLFINSTGYVFAGTRSESGTANGIFRSTDEGSNWTSSNRGLPNISAWSLAINSSDQIFMGSLGSGIYRFSGDGDSWIQVDMPYAWIRALSTSPNSNIYAASNRDPEGILRSINNGQTWELIGSTDNYVYDLESNASGMLFAATRGSGVFRSENDGISWVQTNFGMTDTTWVWDLTMNPEGDIFAATSESGVFRSSDNGTTWAPMNAGLPIIDVIITDIDTTDIDTVYKYLPITALAMNSRGYLFAGPGIHRYRDSIEEWERLALLPHEVRAFALNANDDIFVGTDNGIFYSTDDGETWSQLNDGLIHKDVRDISVNSFNRIFVATTGGLFRSSKLLVSTRTEVSTNKPGSLLLRQNFPNPFNPITTIRYNLPKANDVVLTIYNLLGQEIRTVVNERQGAGEKLVVWDGRDQFGNVVSSGIYIYRIQTGGFIKSRKMILVR